MGARDVEFVVVGAGVLGLSAAWSLARRGREVVVCERATVGHGGSGSKGSARIFRLGYDEPGYVRLALTAERLWRRLEAESGTAILTTTGQVTFGDDLEVLTRSLAEAGAPYELLGHREVTERFPVLSVPGPAVWEPSSGVIAADRCLAALRQGIEVRQRTRVMGIDDDGRRVRVVVQSEEGRDELRASAVIVCAGPWTGPLLSGGGVGLRALATMEQVAYLAPATGVDGVSVDEVPVFVERRDPWFYGLPVRSEGLVKISLHGAGPAVVLDHLDGDEGDEGPDPELVAELNAAARRVLRGLAAEPAVTERCLYDNTADGDFVVDRRGRVVVGSGTSGHGFKFAPLLGEVLADLATGVPPGHQLGVGSEVERFRSSRLLSLGHRSGPTVHP